VNHATLIITADDLGLCPEVGAGVVEAARAGVVTAASLFVNPPFEPDLAPFAGLDISLGLHLNLTLGRPVSAPASVPSLVGRDGEFGRSREEFLASWQPAEAERELAAQLARFRSLVGREPEHLNFHKHLADHDARLFDLVLELAPARCPVRTRTPDARQRCRDRGVLTCDHFVGDVCPGGFWTKARMAETLAGLAPGVTELMCHPGMPMAAQPGIWYAPERDVERRTLLAATIRTRLAQVRLAGFDCFRNGGVQ
jgi:predicted glycoside hydrolase/deacetylase ChbG (UPF0249 family)